MIAGFMSHQEYVGREPFGERYTAFDLWFEMGIAAVVPSLSVAGLILICPSRRRFNWKQGVFLVTTLMIATLATWLIWSVNQECWLLECD